MITRREFLGSMGGASLALLGLTALRPSEGRALARPNVLVILTDDQPPRTLNPRHMPKTWRRVVEQGVRFPKAYAAIPICGPARASVLKSQYAHNHGILLNNDGARFHKIDSDTIATRLQLAGYATGMFGKYMNNHDPDRIAPGWDRWFAFHSGYYEPVYKVKTNNDGVQSFDRSKWNEARLLADRAGKWIGGAPKPWFAYVAPNDPHGPYFPSSQHLHDYDGAKVPKPPNYNEADVSDKPQFIRDQPPIADQQQDPNKINEGKLEELQDVDDLVNRLVGKLVEIGQLENTYVFFCSDNGWLNGEHRFIGKGVPYEGSTQVPFVVRGPGVVRNVASSALVSQVDLSATICDVAGASLEGMDGRSLLPVLGADPSAAWRKRLLSESPTTPPGTPAGGWYKLRDGQWSYAEWGSNERELYDLSVDPFQLESLHASAEHQSVVADLAAKLDTLRTTSGDALRAAEEE